MLKSFLVSMFAVLLFALGATGSWFYMQMDEKQEAPETTAQLSTLPNSTQVDPVPKREPSSLPAVVRGPTLDAEEMFRLTTATKEKREQLRQYEERLRDHKLRIKAADADTKSAQREVEGILGQVRNLMDGAEKLLDDVKLTLDELKKQKLELKQKTDALKALEDNVGAGAAKSVTTFGEYLQSMPPEVAAGAIKEMTNDGKMDFVIQLLRTLEARNVSKILAELQDPQLLAELASRFPDAPLVR